MKENNTVQARVEIRNTMIVYEYLHNNNLYEIQVPKTDDNKHLQDGDMIVIQLAFVKED